MDFTLQQLLTLDAVITQGSFQAGADFLNKTHPSVIAALRKLENDLGFTLFDRSGYRTVLTEQGSLFYARSKRLLGEMNALREHATSIRKGEAVELNVVLGDVTPPVETLSTLRRFGEEYPNVRLNLFFENLAGPNQRLLAGEADLILHHIDKADPRYDYRDICQVSIVPVVAPGFLRFPVTKELRYSDLRDYTQCIIRDTASDDANKSYFVLPDSPHITVGDQYTKKEIIKQGMGWGHMPHFLIEEELRSRQLVLIDGNYIQGVTVDIVVARQSDREHGKMAECLWQMFE
jgi:DNA-binding transcriptional LysR family regulator